MSIEESTDHFLLDEHDEEGHSFTLEDWKILSICIFPFLGVLGISLAVLLGTRAGHKLWFTCGVMFSAGILLAGALCHALPHANEMFSGLLGENDSQNDSGLGDHGAIQDFHDDDHDHNNFRRYLQDEQHHNHEEDESHHDHAFPWANMIFGLTFLLLLVIEAYAERFVDNAMAKSDNKQNHRKESVKCEDLEESSDKSEEPTEADEECCAEKKESNSDHHLQLPTGNNDNKPSLKRQGSSGGLKSLYHPQSGMKSSCSLSLNNGFKRGGVKSRSTRSSSWMVTAKRASVVGFNNSNLNSSTNNGAECEDFDSNQTINPWVAILLLIVLSFHVLIEGLTIGSANSIDVIKSTFVAIASHKIFGAFTLGSSFITAGYWEPESRKLFVVLSCIYIGMDILGIGLGMALSSTFKDDTFALAIFQSMLGGSFLFVAAVELIPGELEKTRKHKFPVFVVLLSLCIGYGLMTLIGKWF